MHKNIIFVLHKSWKESLELILCRSKFFKFDFSWGKWAILFFVEEMNMEAIFAVMNTT